MLGLHSLLVLAASNPPAGPLLLGIVFGFLIGVVGHIVRSNALILLGIAVLGVTVLIFVIDGLQTR